MSKNVKIIATLGPATRKEGDLLKMRDRGVDFVRINISHSSLEDLRYFIALAKKVGIPFIIDTEGSQIRSGNLESAPTYFNENDIVALLRETDIQFAGNKSKIFIRPKEIISKFETGDILYMDFDALVLHVIDVSRREEGFVSARVISGGMLGNNKGVIVDSALGKSYDLPALSPKDLKAIEIGLKENVGYVAASFMRSGNFVDEVRKVTEGKMKIISKIECQDALDNLDDIIAKSDFLLIDRGDLSKEAPIEEIPILQKEIIAKAAKSGKGVYVATDLLETMVEKKKPTRAEVCDIVNTILDGAYGLALVKETAIGKYPIECVNMLRSLIAKTESDGSDNLTAPHGGKLIDRTAKKIFKSDYLGSLKKLEIGEEMAMDAEQRKREVEFLKK